MLPALVTISVTSSRNHGLFSGFTRVHRPVPCFFQSSMLAISMAPARAWILASAGMASSRLARMTSTFAAISGVLERTFSLWPGTKWIMRSSFTGSSRAGSGAPIASGLKNWRGVRVLIVAPRRVDHSVQVSCCIASDEGSVQGPPVWRSAPSMRCIISGRVNATGAPSGPRRRPTCGLIPSTGSAGRITR